MYRMYLSMHCPVKIQNGRQMCKFVAFALSTLNTPDVAGGKVSPRGNISHYYFYIAGILRGQNQPVDQVTAAADVKYFVCYN